MSDDSIGGFALRRNGSCLSTETECGPTSAPFYACCPGSMACSNPYNQVCCPSGNCTTTVVQNPVCGDRSWSLYNNGGVDSGYFCCLSTSFGYDATTTDSSGCGNEGYELQAGEVALQLLSQAAASSSTSASSSSATTSITSAASSTDISLPATSNLAPSTASDGSVFPTNTSPASSSGSSSSGPVIGGAVAGVIGVVLLAALGFFIYRKRRRTRPNKEQSNPHEPYYGYGNHPHNKTNYREVVELSDSQVVELPSSEQLTPQGQKRKQQPVELPS